MKKHVRVYLKEMGYGEQDCKICEICEVAEACQVHHIRFRGMGGNPALDKEGNLIGCCFECHRKAEDGTYSIAELERLHAAFKRRHHIHG
jgi:hypothetical protein